MSFEPLTNYLFSAKNPKQLSRQAEAALVCEKAKQFFRTTYQKDPEEWLVLKWVDATLFIKPLDGNQASDLFLKKYEILEAFKSQEFLSKIKEIRFQK